MASRKMTFSVPEKLAAELIKRVPSRDRSRYVAEAVALRLKGRERDLIRACVAANQDPDVLALEREMNALADEIVEPWIDSPAR